MIGSWRWSVGFAGFGAALTFLFSFMNNPPVTTAMRCLYAFISFGLLSLFVRFVLGQLLKPAIPPAAPLRSADERGTVLDLTTPDDVSINDLLKEQRSGGGNPIAGFTPLKPTKLVSLEHRDPEEVVQAIRRLTDER